MMLFSAYCFIVIFSLSEEAPLELFTTPPLHTSNSSQDVKESTGVEGHEVNLTYTSNRGFHLRTLFTNTTLGYEEWWYLTTTKRPFFSARDYPGKVGVASWKEILPNKEKNDDSETRASADAQKSAAKQVFASGFYKLLFCSSCFLLLVI